MRVWHIDPPVCCPCLLLGYAAGCVTAFFFWQPDNCNVIDMEEITTKPSSFLLIQQADECKMSCVFKRVTSEHSKRTLGPINLIPYQGDPPLSLRRLPVFPCSITGNRRRARARLNFSNEVKIGLSL